MTDNQNEKPKQDWNALAQEALDIWQNHLNSMANDPKMKEDMANLVTPMTQMFAQWTDVMQSSLQTMAGFTATQNAPEQEQPQPSCDNPSCDMAETSEVTQPVADEAPTEPTASNEQADGAAADVSAQDVGADIQQPISEPFLVQQLSAQQFEHKPQPVDTVQPPARGRAASTDGSRDLAQLASRLAELERELDSLRPKAKRTDTSSDTTDDGDVQQVAGTRQG